jgi:hypothetical protein
LVALGATELRWSPKFPERSHWQIKGAPTTCEQPLRNRPEAHSSHTHLHSLSICISLVSKGLEPNEVSRLYLQSGCVFRFKSDTDSGAIITDLNAKYTNGEMWMRIPIQVGHLFRFKSDTDSGQVGHPRGRDSDAG